MFFVSADFSIDDFVTLMTSYKSDSNIIDLLSAEARSSNFDRAADTRLVLSNQ